MPDNYGPWTGVGVGLGNIGQALSTRFDRQYQVREQQADKYEKQAQDIAANIAQMGGAQAPEAAPLMQELRRTVMLHNSLYKAHETPDLVQRIGRFTQKMVGKQPGPFQPTIEAPGTMTAEGMVAAAPRGQKEDLQALYGQAFQMLQKANPDKTSPEDLKELQTQAAEWVLGQRGAEAGDAISILGGAGAQPMTDAEGNTFLYGMHRKSGQVVKVPVPGFRGKGQASPEDIKTYADMWSSTGKAPAAAFQAETYRYMQEHGMKLPQPKDSSRLGQLTDQILAAGLETNRDAAKTRAGKLLAGEAEARAASAAGGDMGEEQLESLATWYVLSNHAIAPSISAMRNPAFANKWNRALANLAQSGKVGSLIAGRADIKADEATLTDLTKREGTISALEDTAKSLFAQTSAAAERLDQDTYVTSLRVFNDWLLRYDTSVSPNFAGSEDAQRFQSLLYEALMDYAQVVMGQTSRGVGVSNRARDEARELLPAGFAAVAPKLNDWIKTAATPSMAARTTALRQGQQGMRDNITRAGGAAPGPTPTPSAPPAQVDPNDPLGIKPPPPPR